MFLNTRFFTLPEFRFCAVKEINTLEKPRRVEVQKSESSEYATWRFPHQNGPSAAN
jgi:hypothetical protein